MYANIAQVINLRQFHEIQDSLSSPILDGNAEIKNYVYLHKIIFMTVIETVCQDNWQNNNF